MSLHQPKVALPPPGDISAPQEETSAARVEEFNAFPAVPRGTRIETNPGMVIVAVLIGMTLIALRLMRVYRER